MTRRVSGADTSRVIEPEAWYLSLSDDGAVELHAGGDAFWSQSEARLQQIGARWLVSEYAFESDWPTWEMHPEADEFVYLLEGAVELRLELPGGIEAVSLVDRGAVIVPKGIWHTAKVHRPSRMLHVTLGRGTQTRPA